MRAEFAVDSSAFGTTCCNVSTACRLRAELSGLLDFDNGSVLPAYGHSGDYLFGASEWKVASGRHCGSAGRIPECKDVVLDFVWPGTGVQSNLRARYRGGNHASHESVK